MPKLLCVICKSISTSKSIGKYKKRRLSKLIQVYERIRVAKLQKRSASICKNCFHEADDSCKFYKKFQLQTMKKRLSIKRKIKLKNQNVSSQTVPQKFVLILNQIPEELFSTDCSEDRLKSIFCEYGIISEVYSGKNRSENFVRITFLNEQASPSTWDAIRKKIKEIYGDQVVTTLIAENKSPINILPDECLLRILSFLVDFDDKIILEHVCQRWQQLVPIIWANLKTLYHFENDGDVSIDEWEKILMHSKKSLEEIHIDLIDNAERQFKAVEKNCDNLKNLAIEYYDGPPEKLVKYLESLSTAKQKLRRLVVKNIDTRCNFGFLNNLPENMVEIHLFAEHENSTHLNSEMDFSKFCNLRVLQLCSFEFYYENSLSGLENLVNLEYLTLIGSTVHNSSFEKMQNFRKLKHLIIPSQTVNDDVLSIIIENNQNLEYLDISNNPNILNNTLRTIGELPKLDSLIMKNLHDLDGYPLSNLHKLTLLDCRGCPSITDWELMSLIDLAPNLNRIDVTDCNVTIRLIMSAEESVKRREDTEGEMYIFVRDPKILAISSEIPDRSNRINVCWKYDNVDYVNLHWGSWTTDDEN